MSNINLYGDTSPITAFATTVGNSALTLIRCSGKGSIEMAAQVFSPAKLARAEGNTVLHGWIVNQRSVSKIDEVLISVFRSPKSYTGEDGLDICCHGGPSAGRAVIAALKNAGFRDALPGEFSFRAFMNGKIDLTKAESVMELVSAKTETGREHAVMRLSGALENEINGIKQLLVEILSAVEIYLDYSEDEISADENEIAGIFPKRELALTVLDRLKALAAGWKNERIYQEGILTVIAGRPNAGKSSLFNLLLKEDRSIVTDIPGTTRDWIEAWLSVEGIPIRLIDTAGLRALSADPVEKIGMEKSRKLLDEAELILYLIDISQGITFQDEEFLEDYKDKPLIVLWNKCDIGARAHSDFHGINFSVKTEEGLLELFAAIVELTQVGKTDLPALGSARQKDLVDNALCALEEALTLEPLDLAAPLLREAVNSLGEITGEIFTEDILNEMFSKFCVGK
jgi:tRNA modification GTPase